jgi:dihydroneopterin aldolase
MKNEGYSIFAEDIEIWSRTGLHPEEALVENHFMVSVYIMAQKPYQGQGFINYEVISEKVNTAFNKGHKVLEDICADVIDEIKGAIATPLASIECRIKKLRPAVDGMKVGALGVNIIREY